MPHTPNLSARRELIPSPHTNLIGPIGITNQFHGPKPLTLEHVGNQFHHRTLTLLGQLALQINSMAHTPNLRARRESIPSPHTNLIGPHGITNQFHGPKPLTLEHVGN